MPTEVRHLGDAGMRAIVLAVLAAVLVLLSPGFGALHALWTDTDDRAYTHGYLVLGICAWLVWRALPEVLAARPAPAPMLLVPLALATAVWAIALTAGVQDLHLLMLPVITWLAIAAVTGARAARSLLLPIGFFVFALPLWSSGNFILLQMTVWVNTALVWMTGITAYVNGNFVQVPAGMFEIADGCSGLHFFVVGLAVAVLYGEIGRDTLRRRIEWVALIAVLSVVANWLRVFTIIVAGYVTDMQHYLVRVDHYRFGWFVFAGVLMLFFWIANRRAGPAGAPANTARAQAGVPLPRAAMAAGVTVLVAAIFPLLAWRAVLGHDGAPADAFPVAMTDAAPPRSPSGWQPVYPGASSSGFHVLQVPAGEPVEVFQAAYARQQQGAELVGGGTSLFGDERIELVDERRVGSANGPWREWELQTGAAVFVVRAHWQIGGRRFARPAASQLWYGVARLFAPIESRVVALRVQCQEDCAAARAALDEAGELLSSQSVAWVPDTRIGR